MVVERGAQRVEVGVEAAGHYHRPVTASGLLPAAWELVELNPAHVTEQRRVLGKRGVKTDQVDLVAMHDLLVAGRGQLAGRRDEELLELQAWAALRLRRVVAVIAAKNQLLAQMDRAFPGASACVWASLLDTPLRSTSTTPRLSSSEPSRLVNRSHVLPPRPGPGTRSTGNRAVYDDTRYTVAHG